MRIEFKLIFRDSEEKHLIDDFLVYIRNCIRLDILTSIPPAKLYCYEQDLIDTSIIDWKRKPKSIDMDKLLEYIANSVIAVRTKKCYVIRFSGRSLPGTYTSVDTVVRFLDKGNEEFPGMHIFGTIFSRYRSNMDKYWELFILKELNRVSVSEVLIIR